MTVLLQSLRSFKSVVSWGSYKALRNLLGQCEQVLLPRPRSWPTVSFCTTVKDRFDHLQQTLLQNLADNEDYPHCEFVLLNYACPDPRTAIWVQSELQPFIKAGRLNYYYYPDSQLFERSHARNLSFKVAQGEILCNVDADNFTGSHFAEYVATVLQEPGSFLQGPADGRGLAGRLCIRRSDWLKVGGYDERFKNWGSEDGDLANRLQLAGIKRKLIYPERFCQAIQHDNEVRTRYHTQPKQVSLKDNRALKEENLRAKLMCPNGSVFGQGLVQKNFGEWIQVP